MAKSPHEVLGVNPGASADEIKKAYRTMVKQYHPDNYKNHPLEELAKEKMQEINDAYDQLTNPNYRDTSKSGQPGNPGQPWQQNPNQAWQQQWQQRQQQQWQQQQPPRNGPYYGRNTSGAGDICESLSCLCCADSCCECMGGDICGCC